MAKGGELRGWTAMIYFADSRDVVGAVRRSQRLHRTLKDGQAGAENWASELGHEIVWQSVDDLTLIGRIPATLWWWPASYYQKVFAKRPWRRKDRKPSARRRPDRVAPDAVGAWEVRSHHGITIRSECDQKNRCGYLVDCESGY